MNLKVSKSFEFFAPERGLGNAIKKQQGRGREREGGLGEESIEFFAG